MFYYLSYFRWGRESWIIGIISFLFSCFVSFGIVGAVLELVLRGDHLSLLVLSSSWAPRVPCNARHKPALHVFAYCLRCWPFGVCFLVGVRNELRTMRAKSKSWSGGTVARTGTMARSMGGKWTGGLNFD